MKVHEIHEFLLVFGFDEIDWCAPTNVTVIARDRCIHVVDTFLGPDAMEMVVAELSRRGLTGGHQGFLVFNTHGDWDHHFGNCYFPATGLPWDIIAHEETAARILEEGPRDVLSCREYLMGEVIVTPPTVTFKKRHELPSQGISLFHAPGHTSDSSACWLPGERVLVAGDNVEYPIPYITSPDLGVFIKTLEYYESLDPRLVIPGHGAFVAGPELLRENLDYLVALRDGDTERFENEPWKRTHEENMSVLLGDER